MTSAREEAANFFLDQLQPAPGVTVTITPERRYVRDWARELIARGHKTGDIPTFGSPEWCRLPDDDPRKGASAIRAAMAWLQESDDLPFRIAQEDADRRTDDDRHWAQIHAGRRALVDATLDERQVRERRRAHAHAMTERARTGSDYPGGGLVVAWEPSTRDGK